MEAVVTSSQDVSQTAENHIEFERNLDVFTKTLDGEKTRLGELENAIQKLQLEIDEMHQEIMEEKKHYRKAIDRIIEERENVSRLMIEHNSSIDLTPIQSSLDLFEASGYKHDIDIDSEIEQIRNELMESNISTKEDYILTIKEHIQQTKSKTQK